MQSRLITFSRAYTQSVSVAILLLISASLSFGQTALATVTGTISDTTGAVIANAPVSLKNLENGSVYTGASSASGNFTVSQLSIGEYDLTITQPGFKTYSHTKFRLAAGQTLREDVTLEVGQAAESITVSADATLLQTESSELSHNITLSQMNNLPITPIGQSNQGFRDPFQAVRMLAGVRYAAGGTANTMVINGTPANSMQVRLDGQTQGALGTTLAGAIGQHQPSVDAIEEVAIQTSNFAAEYGTAGGAVVNMVSKSGTNQYHGSAYDYMRNEALDAHQPYTGLRNKVRQNDWGFTIGGPVRIPWLYDGTNKTFFFWNYEQFRNKQIIFNGSSTVPIAAYRTGDFSNLTTQENRLLTQAATGVTTANPRGNCPGDAYATVVGNCNYLDPLGNTLASGSIFDPLDVRTVNGTLVRGAFPGNRIPVARFDATSQKVLALVPMPLGVNHDRGQISSNYQRPYDQSRTSQIPSIKIDQNIGSKNKVSFYLSETKTRTPRSPTGADNFPDDITASISSFSAATSARINWDYTATSQLLLHFGVGWNDIDFLLDGLNNKYNAMTELGLRQARVGLFPQFVTGSSGGALGGMSNLGTGSGSKSYERRPAFNVSATYVAGKHTYKVGAEYRLEKYPNYTFNNSAGTYTFGTNYTTQSALQGVQTNQGFAGFAFASFMLGGMSNMNMAYPISASTSKSQSSLFIQDNWKVTRKLTIDLGLRWDYGTYASEMYGRYSSFNPLVASPVASGRLGARAFEATCNCNFADNYPFAIGPRAGFAYQFDRKTVIRAGLGLVYDATSNAAGGAVNTNFAPSVGFGQTLGLLRDGTPAAINPVWPNFDAAAGFQQGSVNAMPSAVDPNAGRPARQVQWNVTMQREINRNLVVEAAYVANRGIWWEASGLVNLNALTPDVLINRYGFKDFTSSTEAALLTGNLSTVAANATQGPILRARGINLPYPNFPGGSQTVRQSLLPYPQYNSSALSGAPLGNTWYDSFQLTVTKRFSHGLSGTFNYTYAKSLEIMSAPDVFNRSVGKNLGGFDQPHQIRLTVQYQIPETKNSGLPVLRNKYVSQAVSGWGIGWYSSYQSAGLVARPLNGGATPISQFLGRGPGAAQLRKDANGKYMNPWSVDWYDYSGKHHTDPIDINCHCFDVTKTVVLNPDPSIWENVPSGQWASDTGSYRFFRGMRFPSESANLSRNFRFGTDGRYTFNIRIELSNVFNRLQYPGLYVQPLTFNLPNFATAPTKYGLVDGRPTATTGLYSAGFGVINPTQGTTGQRLGTFVGRFIF